MPHIPLVSGSTRRLSLSHAKRWLIHRLRRELSYRYRAETRLKDKIARADKLLGSLNERKFIVWRARTLTVLEDLFGGEATFYMAFARATETNTSTANLTECCARGKELLVAALDEVRKGARIIQYPLGQRPIQHPLVRIAVVISGGGTVTGGFVYLVIILVGMLGGDGETPPMPTATATPISVATASATATATSTPVLEQSQTVTPQVSPVVDAPVPTISLEFPQDGDTVVSGLDNIRGSAEGFAEKLLYVGFRRSGDGENNIWPQGALIHAEEGTLDWAIGIGTSEDECVPYDLYMLVVSEAVHHDWERAKVKDSEGNEFIPPFNFPIEGVDIKFRLSVFVTAPGSSPGVTLPQCPKAALATSSGR